MGLFNCYVQLMLPQHQKGWMRLLVCRSGAEGHTKHSTCCIKKARKKGDPAPDQLMFVSQSWRTCLVACSSRVVVLGLMFASDCWAPDYDTSASLHTAGCSKQADISVQSKLHSSLVMSASGSQKSLQWCTLTCTLPLCRIPRAADLGHCVL